MDLSTPKKTSPTSSPTSSSRPRSRSLCRITGLSMEEHNYIPANHPHFIQLERCQVTHGDYDNDCNYFPLVQKKSWGSFDRSSLSKHNFIPLQNLQLLKNKPKFNSSESIAIHDIVNDNPSLLIRKSFKDKHWASMEGLANQHSNYSSAENLSSQLDNERLKANQSQLIKKLTNRTSSEKQENKRIKKMQTLQTNQGKINMVITPSTPLTEPNHDTLFNNSLKKSFSDLPKLSKRSQLVKPNQKKHIIGSVSSKEKNAFNCLKKFNCNNTLRSQVFKRLLLFIFILYY